MTRDILDRYTAAEKELALIEQEITSLNKVKETVRGSMLEHPYLEHRITVEGYQVDDQLLKLLCEKRKHLKSLRTGVEEFLANVKDPLISASIRLRYLRGLTWQRVALEIGGGNTDEGIKQMVRRYLKKSETGCA